MSIAVLVVLSAPSDIIAIKLLHSLSSLETNRSMLEQNRIQMNDIMIHLLTG